MKSTIISRGGRAPPGRKKPLLFAGSRSHAEAPALFRGDIHLSYAELAQQICTISDGLRSLDVLAGERVAVYLNKRIECAVAYFASSHAGAVFVPINPVLKPAQVEHILNDCTVSVLVTSSANAKTLTEQLANCHSLRHLIVVDDTKTDIGVPEHVDIHSWFELLDSSDLKLLCCQLQVIDLNCC